MLGADIGAREYVMDEQGSTAQVTLPAKCAEHGVKLTYTSAEARLVDGVLTVLVQAEPHQGDVGWCSQSFGQAVEVK